jgi:hypothetical protein
MCVRQLQRSQTGLGTKSEQATHVSECVAVQTYCFTCCNECLHTCTCLCRIKIFRTIVQYIHSILILHIMWPSSRCSFPQKSMILKPLSRSDKAKLWHFASINWHRGANSIQINVTNYSSPNGNAQFLYAVRASSTPKIKSTSSKEYMQLYSASCSIYCPICNSCLPYASWELTLFALQATWRGSANLH